jgi:hypothetical protein
MNNYFYFKIEKIQPSQLFLSDKKVNEVSTLVQKFGFEILKPLPIKELNNEIILIDGHTRAYILWLNGIKEIKVIWEKEDLDWELYAICVNWCKESGIYTIADLKDRIISHKSYQIKWVQRCEEMEKKLQST